MFVAGAIGAANWALVDRPVSAALARDSRNEGIGLHAYYRWAVDPTTVVIDLRSVSGNASIMDVTRTLIVAAEALKDRSFDRAILAWRGTPRFVLEGDYFRRLGEEREWQNPVYTVRTLPEHVLRLDGSHAFGRWTGGVLGVLTEQMNDHEEFHREWYITSILEER
jgi:hypothetical protein